MANLDIRRGTVLELECAEGMDRLLAEYSAESAIKEIGPHNPQWQSYRAMEQAGMLSTFIASDGDQVVGFLLLLLPVLPHFGRCVAVTESYFVAQAHRKTGAGTHLRLAAEAAAAAAGARGMLMSSPEGGQLGQVLPRVGYRKTNETFFKAFP
jgi:GNAT superfamily N-acetyltransferase